MKILIVNKFLHPNGGSETYIFKLGEQLQRTGHQVQYFGMEHEGRIVGNTAQSYTADMDFHAGGLGKLLYPFRIIYSGEAKRKIRLVLEDFQPDVVHLNNINFQLTPSVIYAVRSYEKKYEKKIYKSALRARCAERARAMLQSNMRASSTCARLFKERLCLERHGHKCGRQIKIVYTAHDYQWVCPNHMMRIPATGEICFACRGGDYKQCSKNRCIHNSRVKSLLGTIEAEYYARRRTYGMVDVIVCPSEFMKKQLDTDPLLADKTVMMHNFIDAETADTGNVSEQKKDYVLYFGRFSEEKGTMTLLEACKALPDIPFVFAGTGPLEEHVNGVPNVENRGFVTGEALRSLIAGARFSVYPSEWYENCPFSVMESQMYGTPVLASDLGGAPELVQPGKTGDLFRGGDVQELTEHIRALWNAPELCREYSENCKNINFDTIEEYCDKIVRKVYT